MDNMLYIIAGLVIILMIVVWVLRKNKAQNPPVPPRAQTVNKDKDNAATLAANAQQETPTQKAAGGVTSSATKFDNLTVAQRFMDQQRYDKAIETLERGLIEKPHDNQLFLKLLNIYALTNQQEDFNSTYVAIKTHSDATTIEQAQQLKALLDAEQAPVSFGTAADTSMNLDSETPLSNIKDTTSTTDIGTDDMSLDFDISTSPTDHEKTSTATANLNNDNSNAFDLTLEDLETADLEQDTLEVSSTDTLEDPSTGAAAEPDAKAAVLDIDTFNNINDASNINDSSIDNNVDDFTLDFDLLSDDTSGDLTEDSEENELILSDDGFVLDFDGLAEETDADTEKHAAASNQDSIDDDFTLFINVADHDTVTADDATINAPTTQDSSQNPNLESSDDDTLAPLDALSLEDEPIDNADFIDLDVNSDEKTSTPTFDDNTLTFDDDTVIGDFDSDTTDASPTTMTPVTAESDSLSLDNQDKDTLPSADFAAQFAADFDFVKTLDNHQVTLDLASQYLHLGEYDSAKRLLNEVLAQGNCEQQQQAQELLARTA